jgi:glycosyltransferase involved in cell wall biosynthesis
MNEPLVSVLVMMYRPGGVDITLAAMRDQTFKDFELIIVDNRYERRKDEVAALATKYGVRTIHAPEHRRNGKWIVACAAFNTAIALARGKYVIILHDFSYVPPGWIEAHIGALEGHPTRYVTVDHVNVDLPEIVSRRPLDHNKSTDRNSYDLDDVFSDGSLDEICIFKKGPFDASWLPLPIGPDQWQTGLPELHRTNNKPEHGWVTLTNDSFHRNFMYKLNGIDERFDMGRGPFDANLGVRVEMNGGETYFMEEPKAILMNPRFIMRTLPFGSHTDRTPGRWTYQDGRDYYYIVRNTVPKRLRAANPYDLTRLAATLEPWRDPGAIKVPQQIPDLAYWRTDLNPGSDIYDKNKWISKNEWISKKEWAEESWGDHHLWRTVRKDPKISIVVAMTEEPRWKDCLESIRGQDEPDFSCLVVGDCPLPDMWDYAKQDADPRFSYHFSPALQGLCKVWNMGLHEPVGEYVVLMGAENPLPRDFLSTCTSVLDEHPEFGYVVPSVKNEEDLALGWLFVITRECARMAGPFDRQFAPGGLGMALDWKMRIQDLDFQPRRLSIEVEHTRYSIQDKCSDWTLIERLDVLRAKWGIVPGGTPWDVPPYPDRPIEE